MAAVEEGVSGVALSDAELALIGWFITDGHLNQRTRQLTISQAEASPYHEAIRVMLDACGFAWSVSRQRRDTKYADGSVMLRYTVPKWRSRTREGGGWGRLAEWLDKDLAPGLEAVSPEQLGVLLDAMHMGDGNKRGAGRYEQRTYEIGIGNRLLADRLQALCVRRGWRSNVQTITTSADEAHYLLRAKRSTWRSIKGNQMKRVDAVEGERVWCVENDLGTLVVRRDGKTAIVGNCEGRYWRDGQTKNALSYFLVSTAGTDPLMAQVLNLKRPQGKLLVDPDAPLFETVAEDPHVRLRALARGLVDKHQDRKPSLVPRYSDGLRLIEGGRSS
ncbi:MAG TPA: hypothetical protein VK631_17050 [Solirubrobacteraceae bacterium]|nr:hypothetical protein [Solirubrobacteraceae bacterium]